MRYLIIGNGGAGVRAAQVIRSRDAEGEIIIVDRETHPCYYRMRLPDYISGWKERHSTERMLPTSTSTGSASTPESVAVRTVACTVTPRMRRRSRGAAATRDPPR